MAYDAHKNFAYSTVATAPSPATSGTTLVVASGDGTKFPAVPFNATVWPIGAIPTVANAEIVRVTNIATDTLTITRAQESSSARTVVVGDQIAATITKKTITDLETLKADLNAPSFTGGITVSGPVTASGGFAGLTFVGTEYGNVASTIDLRSFGGTAGSETNTPNGTVLGGMHIGGWGGAGVDCAQIYFRATEDFTTLKSGTAVDIYTTTNGGNVKSVALTLDNDGAATFRKGITLVGTLSGATNVLLLDGTFNTVTGALGSFGFGGFTSAPILTMRRALGSAGSETRITSGATLAQFTFQGWNDTSGAYVSSAAIGAVADQDFTTAGFRGTRLQLSTAPSSVNGGALVRLIIDNAGKVYVGATTGGANATIDQSGNAVFAGSVTAGSFVGVTPPSGMLAPTGAIAQTVPRHNAGTNVAALVSAQMLLVGVWLPINKVITSITFVSGTTPLSVGVNQWFALYDSSRGKLAVTSDDTSTAWGASTAKTLNLASPFTTTYEGLHYVACMVKATTVPSLVGVTSTPATKDLAPILSGLSTAALTNPASAPSTAAAITTGQTTVEYAYVS